MENSKATTRNTQVHPPLALMNKNSLIGITEGGILILSPGEMATLIENDISASVSLFPQLGKGIRSYFSLEDGYINLNNGVLTCLSSRQVSTILRELWRDAQACQHCL